MSHVEATRDPAVEFARLQGQPLDLKGLVDSLSRRWPLFVAVTTACVLIAVVSALVMRPVYDAAANIRIDPVDKTGIDLAAVARGAPPDQALVDTEVKIMQSREVAENVVKIMGLTSDPEFDPLLKKSLFGGKRRGSQLEATTDAVSKHLRVVREGETYIVALHVRSFSPAKAANIANAFAHAYMQASIDAKVREAGQESVWYLQRMSAVSAAAKEADAELAQYKATNGITNSSGGDTVAQQQVGTVTEQLATAEAAAAAARSSATSAKQQMMQGGIDTVSNVLNSPTIIELRKERADLLRNRDEILSRYGPKHPETLKVSQQVQGLEQQIRDESERIIAGLENDARIAEAKAASLRSALGSLKEELAKNSRASVQADNLKREADAKNAMLSQLATSAQQAEQQSHVSQSQATLVAQATPPTQSAFPSLPLFASLGLALGLVAASGATVAAETLDAGLRSGEEVERSLGVPFIAFSPLLSSRALTVEGDTMKPWDYVVAKPMSAFAEALRTARSAIRLSDVDRKTKVVAITSALPDEGKTVISVSLARVMAMSGERVLLIDCDLRRNAIEGLLALPVEAGLVEVLTGAVTAARAIVPDKVPGLDVLPLHAASFTPRDLFGTRAMRDLLASLRSRYDYIILDGPPILAVNDARTLATLGDVVLMVAQWGKTPKQAVRSALAYLEHDKAPVAGVILSKVDTRSSLAGYAGSGYYSAYTTSRYARYYNN
jgi:capsular exopolysaccharide synthesis family protein